MKLTTQLHKCTGQRMSVELYLHSQYAFMAWCSVKKSTGTTWLYLAFTE